MRKVWFSSDFHFNHTNICGPAISSWSRGFRNFGSLVEMNDTIINNLNSLIAAEDVLYFLGDFAFGDKTKIPELRNRINCREIHLIFGNHDHAIRRSHEFKNLFATTRDIDSLVINRQQIHVCHYPMDVFENNHRGAIALFGHCHGSFKNPIGRRMDVGVDTNNFMPYSMEQVVDICNAKETFLPDHHY